MRLNKLIRDFFGFSRTEVNGTLILMSLIILLLFTPYLYRQILRSNPYTSSEDERLLDSLVFLINANFERFNTEELSENEYFDFDPNTVSIEEMVSLGIPRFLAGRINNYRSRGGKFFKRPDLLKIYDFPDSLYQRLFPYILLPEKKNETVKSSQFINRDSSGETVDKVESNETKKMEVALIDINAADSTLFKSLRGIGSSYARRIISYRKLLGGYHSIDQLKEVYGMTDSLFQNIQPYLQLNDTSTMKKLPINIATFKELLAHPYIGYEQTKEIFNIKSKSGKFRKAEDMFRLSLMDSAMIKKLLPYLDFR